jgi:hypothetical protein
MTSALLNLNAHFCNLILLHIEFTMLFKLKSSNNKQIVRNESTYAYHKFWINPPIF